MRVALLAADPTIEELLVELITYAGYEPVRESASSAGTSLRLAMGDVAMIDVCLPTVQFREILTTAKATRTALVLFGSSAGVSDLRTFAAQQGAEFFLLPGGPKALKRVLDGAARPIERAKGPGLWRAAEGFDDLPISVSSTRKRTQMLVAMIDLARASNRELLRDSRELLEIMRERREALRNSVMDYARVLRNAGLPYERATVVVAELLQKQDDPAGDGVVGLIDAAARWVEQVYTAA